MSDLKGQSRGLRPTAPQRYEFEISHAVMMCMVALQSGVQPAVTKACVRQAVSAHSLVMAELAVSILLAAMIVPWEAVSDWSFLQSLLLAGPPAFIYALRSMFKQAAYRKCDGVTFNVINQMKVVFCAISAWVLLGEGQSFSQCLALCSATIAGGLLVLPMTTAGPRHSALLDVNSPWPTDFDAKLDAPKPLTSGAALALATACCSGLAAALSEVALRDGVRPAAFFNLELSLWGLPIVALSFRSAATGPFGEGWTYKTMVPVLLQALGGLVVSAVVQLEGGVAMGLCTVAGILVSAMVETIWSGRPPSRRQVFAASLAAFSIVVHQRDELLLDSAASDFPAPGRPG